MNNNEISPELLEQIWKDANFPIKEKLIKNKQPEFQKFKKIKDNVFIAKCKICNLEIKLPCTYKGEFPLCISHRNPNDRLEMQMKD
tara:strand:- start:5 stop:262 length:258 start_codon:yes stop_codon:yes gene_type:complete